YSLGVILFELLTGRVPFQGSMGQVMAQFLTQPPPRPGSLRRGLDPKLEAICLKAMAKKAGDRHAGMQAFADALDAWLGGTQRLPAPTAHPRRRRWPLVAAALAGVAAVALGVVLYVNTRQGKIRIEVNDPNAVVFIDGEEVRIEKLGEPITLKPGEHGLVVKRGDGVAITKDFTVMRGDNPVLKITLDPPGTPPAANKAHDTRLYEMRVYYAAAGKLDALNARFRDHTLKLFEKHGMTNVGYFVPIGDNKEDKLVYFLAYPSKEAREKAWKAFTADPAWKQVQAESERDGKLVAGVEQRFLTVTDYSPELKMAKGDRVFELRTYTATKGNLGALDARFRDHTLKLFEKHGMTNVVYWHLAPDQEGADTTLVYLLAHESPEAAKKSFEAFRQDPDWIKVRTASEDKAGGLLTEGKNGVVSEFLEATDYSPVGARAFRALFNGKDLSGWSVDTGDAECWTVEDGELVYRLGNRRRGWLLTERDYADFVLRLEFKFAAGANSGIAFRAAPGEGLIGGRLHPEIQLQDDSFPAYSNQQRVQRTGALYAIAIDRLARLKEVGEWNTIGLEVRGSKLRVVVNGDQVLQTDLKNYDDQAERVPGLERSSGRIGLQCWVGSTRFRKIEIKELKPE
ncbi:MAG TPA: family 16 glycoside hydrolase, partial [Gemmataceae bacterium]|nr:family 16 glycoside hydrolase [Gemmataceae bacterium]